MLNITGKTWWGKSDASGAIAGGSFGLALFAKKAMVKLAGTAVSGGTVLGYMLSIDAAYKTCMRYHCTLSTGAIRVVAKKGCIWDKVKYSCPQGVIFEFGETFSELPDRRTGPPEKFQWER